MSLEFNVGDIVTRVRRALSVRGRMPLDLDERCSIQVQAMDCDKAPYRQDGARFYTTGIIAASVGNVSTVGIQTVTGPLVANPQIAHVIDGAWISNPGGALIEVDIGFASFALGIAPGVNIATRTARYPERGDGTSLTDAALFALGPAQLVQQNSPASPNLIQDVVVLVPANSTVYVPLEVTLQAAQFGAQYSASTFGTNQGLAVSWTGRSFLNYKNSTG